MRKMFSALRKYLRGEITSFRAFKEEFAKERLRREGPAEDTAAQRFLEGPVNDQIYLSAPASMRCATDACFRSDDYLRKMHRADWQGVQTPIAVFAARFVLAARAKKVPLYVHTAFRNPQLQADMVVQGVSNTPPPMAAHCQGAAVDIVHSNAHWNLTEREWKFLGKLGKQVAERMGISVVWGGDWSFYDPAHWELDGWRKSAVKDIKVSEPIVMTPHAIVKEWGGRLMS